MRNRWRALQRAASVVVFSLAAFGCSSQEDSSPHELNVMTWWTGTEEARSLDALLEVHRIAHPDIPIHVVPFTGSFTDQLVTVQTRYYRGPLPAAIQGAVGGAAREMGLGLQPVGVSSDAWHAFPPATLELLTYEGSLCGVPLSLRRLNVAYWNKRELDTLTLTKRIPETLAEFDLWLNEVSAAGYTHPLCFSGKDAWVSAHVLFEGIVPALEGPRFSKDYWSGKVTAVDPKMTEALNFGSKIAGYVSRDWLEMGMTAGIVKLLAREPLVSDQCLMTPMGDWGGRILRDAGGVPDVDFVATGWPGASHLTVFDGDAFYLPRRSARLDDVFDLFETMASDVGQIAFAEQRGRYRRARSHRSRALRSPGEKEHGRSRPHERRSAVTRSIGSAFYPFDQLADQVHEFFRTAIRPSLEVFLEDNYARLN